LSLWLPLTPALPFDWSDQDGLRRVRIGPPLNKCVAIKTDAFIITSGLNSMTLWFDPSPIKVDGSDVWRLCAFTPYMGMLEKTSVVARPAAPIVSD
jgi:hypothetical protein